MQNGEARGSTRVSVKTLQRWDREGILKANRTPTDRRYYTYAQYLQFKGINIENDKRQAVIYARVSTKNQKDDLQNQVAFLRQFCNAKGIIDQCIEEYGSGLNYNRKKWNKLLNEVMEQKVKNHHHNPQRQIYPIRLRLV